MTKLQEMRKARGLTAFEFSKRTGIHPANLSKIENARIVAWEKARRLILAEFPGISENDVFDERGLAL